MRSSSLLAAALMIAGCGSADSDYRRAAGLEGSRRFPTAVEAWERFAGRHPDDPRAAEALFRAATLYATVFGRCAQAIPLFEKTIREHPAREPWPTLARRGLLDCPAFFPLKDGAALEYVDSETGGRNMRLPLVVRASTDGVRGSLEGAYYAGTKRFRDYRRTYAKEDWAVYETEERDRVPILKFPYSPGTAWTGVRGGKTVDFRVESDHETVSVKAGTFQDCLKVREAERGAAAWKYDYYAPGVGKVKTTIGTRDSESPNTELSSVIDPGRPS